MYCVKVEVWDDSAEMRLALGVEYIMHASPKADWQAALAAAKRKVIPTIREIIAEEAPEVEAIANDSLDYDY